MAPTSTSPALPLPLARRSGEAERLPLVPTVMPLESHKAHASSDQKEPHELLGLALVATSAVCFSIVTTLVKYETSRGLSAMEAVFWRSAGAFVLNRVCPFSAREHPNHLTDS
jgi:hypothetical protein